MSYCETTRTESHAASCFREQSGCSKVEHVHDGSCYTSNNNRKCPYNYTHTHGAGCVSKVGPLCGGT